jgi:Bacterial tandem repeat domain 1
MKVHLHINGLYSRRPTDPSDPKFLGLGSKDRDEAYFVVVGVYSHGRIVIPRVSPPPPSDYYGLKAGQRAANITLWSGDINDGESAHLIVLLREQDNAQLGAIENAVKGVAEAVVGYFSDNASLTEQGLKDLAVGDGTAVATASKDGDQTIGGFMAAIQVDAGCVTLAYGALPSSAISSSDGTTAKVRATGSHANYTNTWKENAKRVYVGVFRTGTDGHFLWADADSNGLVAKWKELSHKGFRLIDLTTYHDGGQPLYGAVFRAGNDGYALYGANWNDFNANWKTAATQGLRLLKAGVFAPANP